MHGLSESVRIVDWLAARLPAAPPALADVIANHVGRIECTRAELPSTLIDAAVQILVGLGDGRDSANDLLAADALVTYAMEAAAEECEDLEEFGTQAAQQLAKAGAVR